MLPWMFESEEDAEAFIEKHGDVRRLSHEKQEPLYDAFYAAKRRKEAADEKKREVARRAKAVACEEAAARVSSVTNVILTYPLWGNERVVEVNRFFEDEEHRGGSGFVELGDGCHGGTKNLECTILVGAFNYLDLDGLIAHICSLSWRAGGPQGDRFACAHQVQMFVQEQDDDAFKMLLLCDPIVPGEDPECFACLSTLPGLYFDSRNERVTLCRAHVLQLVDHRVRT